MNDETMGSEMEPVVGETVPPVTGSALSEDLDLVEKSRFSETYGRLRVHYTHLDEDKPVNDSLRHSALSRVLMLTVESAKKRVIAQLKDQSPERVSTKMHLHHDDGCLVCACAPYLANRRKHSVEMAVLYELLDRRGQTEDRVQDVPARLLRNRVRTHVFEEQDLVDIYGPHWVSVLTMAYLVEDTHPGALIKYLSQARYLPERSPRANGRDYSHAAYRLIEAATVAPHDIEPSLLRGLPVHEQALLRRRHQNTRSKVVNIWGRFAGVTSCGHDTSQLMDSLVPVRRTRGVESEVGSPA